MSKSNENYDPMLNLLSDQSISVLSIQPGLTIVDKDSVLLSTRSNTVDNQNTANLSQMYLKCDSYHDDVNRSSDLSSKYYSLPYDKDTDKSDESNKYYSLNEKITKFVILENKETLEKEFKGESITNKVESSEVLQVVNKGIAMEHINDDGVESTNVENKLFNVQEENQHSEYFGELPEIENSVPMETEESQSLNAENEECLKTCNEQMEESESEVIPSLEVGKGDELKSICCKDETVKISDDLGYKIDAGFVNVGKQREGEMTFCEYNNLLTMTEFKEAVDNISSEIKDANRSRDNSLNTKFNYTNEEYKEIVESSTEEYGKEITRAFPLQCSEDKYDTDISCKEENDKIEMFNQELKDEIIANCDETHLEEKYQDNAEDFSKGFNKGMENTISLGVEEIHIPTVVKEDTFGEFNDENHQNDRKESKNVIEDSDNECEKNMKKIDFINEIKDINKSVNVLEEKRNQSEIITEDVAYDNLTVLVSYNNEPEKQIDNLLSFGGKKQETLECMIEKSAKETNNDFIEEYEKELRNILTESNILCGTTVICEDINESLRQEIINDQTEDYENELKNIMSDMIVENTEMLRQISERSQNVPEMVSVDNPGEVSNKNGILSEKVTSIKEENYDELESVFEEYKIESENVFSLEYGDEIHDETKMKTNENELYYSNEENTEIFKISNEKLKKEIKDAANEDCDEIKEMPISMDTKDHINKVFRDDKSSEENFQNVKEEFKDVIANIGDECENGNTMIEFSEDINSDKDKSYNVLEDSDLTTKINQSEIIAEDVTDDNQTVFESCNNEPDKLIDNCLSSEIKVIPITSVRTQNVNEMLDGREENQDALKYTIEKPSNIEKFVVSEDFDETNNSYCTSDKDITGFRVIGDSDDEMKNEKSSFAKMLRECNEGSTECKNELGYHKEPNKEIVPDIVDEYENELRNIIWESNATTSKDVNQEIITDRTDDYETELKNILLDINEALGNDKNIRNTELEKEGFETKGIYGTKGQNDCVTNSFHCDEECTENFEDIYESKCDDMDQFVYKNESMSQTICGPLANLNQPIDGDYKEISEIQGKERIAEIIHEVNNPDELLSYIEEDLTVSDYCTEKDYNVLPENKNVCELVNDLTNEVSSHLREEYKDVCENKSEKELKNIIPPEPNSRTLPNLDHQESSHLVSEEKLKVKEQIEENDNELRECITTNKEEKHLSENGSGHFRHDLKYIIPSDRSMDDVDELLFIDDTNDCESSRFKYEDQHMLTNEVLEESTKSTFTVTGNFDELPFNNECLFEESQQIISEYILGSEQQADEIARELERLSLENPHDQNNDQMNIIVPIGSCVISPCRCLTSVIQTLFSCEEFRNKIVDFHRSDVIASFIESHYSEDKMDDLLFVINFCRLFSDMVDKKHRINVKEFRSFNESCSFKECYEIILSKLNSVFKDQTAIKSEYKNDEILTRNNEFIFDLFFGILKTNKSCCRCSFIHEEKHEPIQSIQLIVGPGSGSVDIQQCIDNYFQSTSRNDQMFNCCSDSMVMSSKTFNDCPLYILFHIDMDAQQSDEYCRNYTESSDGYLLPSKNGNVLYTVKAVITKTDSLYTTKCLYDRWYLICELGQPTKTSLNMMTSRNLVAIFMKRFE